MSLCLDVYEAAVSNDSGRNIAFVLNLLTTSGTGVLCKEPGNYFPAG